ncbi:MAG: hypothetical protein KJ905_04060 [Nanoarchaeota archaeon]|nr:hypothetical protein [Nanoarchaeota archaeon]MBU1501915.1 hypothetical protein [Nanoarchaeota archaeon]MBU2459243.1 hypothetical protein [Nanoarchaeota archaeon]
MNFEEEIKKGFIRKVKPDSQRAQSLEKSSQQALQTAKSIPLNENSSKTVFRELYESLRQFCESLGYSKGYKFNNHESITSFLDEVLKEKDNSLKFDRYRKIRNGINYYGDTIDISTVKEALKDIPKIIDKIKRLFDKQ